MAIIDILAIQPQVISRDLRSKYLLLAGAPKIGKTEFCTMAPDALVLAFEIGTNARPGAMIQKIDTWSIGRHSTELSLTNLRRTSQK